MFVDVSLTPMGLLVVVDELMGAFAMLGGGRKEVISSVTRTSGKDVGIRLRPATVPSPVRSLM